MISTLFTYRKGYNLRARAIASVAPKPLGKSFKARTLDQLSISGGVCCEYMVDDCYHHYIALVGWVLCFAWRRRIDTYPACHCRSLSSHLAVDRQEAVEINHSLLFLSSFSPNYRVRDRLVKL
jgi:hypothetical protein